MIQHWCTACGNAYPAGHDHACQGAARPAGKRNSVTVTPVAPRNTVTVTDQPRNTVTVTHEPDRIAALEARVAALEAIAVGKPAQSRAEYMRTWRARQGKPA